MCIYLYIYVIMYDDVIDDAHKQKVDDLVQGNRRIKQSEIAVALGISKERVQHILRELEYRKICARWVPRMLTEEMKKNRVDICRQLLLRYDREKENVLNIIVTGDESWVLHYYPENKRQSMEFRHKTSPCPKKFKVQASAGKVMLTVFWDSKGVIHTEYLEKGSTINSILYIETLKKLKKKD